MSHSLMPSVGAILSADFAVPEHKREMNFYSRILSTGEKPLWREDLMNNLGTPIIGLGERSAEYAHLPLQWMPHIQVADVAASVQRALDLSGRELMHGKDKDGNSQWAVLLDPNGAAFGIIPIVSEDLIPKMQGAVGRIAWLDLTVSDASATRDFYSQVLNWSVQDIEVQHEGEGYIDYNMCGQDGRPVASIRHARGVNQGLPTVWVLHLPVGDLAESVRRIQKEGGKIIQASPAKNGQFSLVLLEDLVGAFIALVPG